MNYIVQVIAVLIRRQHLHQPSNSRYFEEAGETKG